MFLTFPKAAQLLKTQTCIDYICPLPRFPSDAQPFGRSHASGQAGSRPRKLIPPPPVPPRTRQLLFLAISKPGCNPPCLSRRGKPCFWPSRGGFPPAPGHRSGLSLLPTNIRSGRAALVVQEICTERGLPALPKLRWYLAFWMLMCPNLWCKPRGTAGCRSLPSPGASFGTTPKNQQGPAGNRTLNAQDGTSLLFQACWTDRRLRPARGHRGEVFLLGGRGKPAQVLELKHRRGDARGCAPTPGNAP